MLLLQAAWNTDGRKKKMLVMGGMPALMHGVLKPIAMFLAGTYPVKFLLQIFCYLTNLQLPFTLQEIPISTDTNAGATFGYYKFTRESDPKQQLIAAVQAASEAFPYSDKLKDVVKAVTSLPEIPLPVFCEI
jgi:hypothetical protein